MSNRERACKQCSAMFEPPPLSECVPEAVARQKWEQHLCPEHLAVWRAEQDQRDAEARAKNQRACAIEGHQLAPPPGPDDDPNEGHCLRCEHGRLS